MKKFLTIVGAIVVAFFIITLIIGLVAGTSINEPTQAEVRVRTGSKSTCWSGQIDDATREGCGARTYTVSNDLGIIAAVVQKKSDDQIRLTVEIWIDGKLADTAETTAAYGVVTVSATD